MAHIERLVCRGEASQVVTINPEFVMQAQQNEPFRRVLDSADLALADGIGLIAASRLLGQPLPERVAGSDLVLRIAQRAAETGWRLYFLGASPGVAEKAAETLQERHPTLTIVGTYAGSPAQQFEEDILERIRRADPDILFVAYGAPAQDMWIARNLETLATPVAIGVGGALDFVAGRAKRAPHWIQRLGLEWLHRLIREPWRWRRMLALPRFAWAVLLKSMGICDVVRQPTCTRSEAEQ
jgi:N-acetylglucosaminyldiphosphoundecaprenol N-acetyl-beta-D-mannosaminyltransferase